MMTIHYIEEIYSFKYQNIFIECNESVFSGWKREKEIKKIYIFTEK